MFNNHFWKIFVKIIGSPPSCMRTLPNDNFKKNNCIKNHEKLKHIQEKHCSIIQIKENI